VRNRNQAREIRLVESRVRIAIVLLERSGSNDVGTVVKLIETAEVSGAVKYVKGVQTGWLCFRRLASRRRPRGSRRCSSQVAADQGRQVDRLRR